MVPNIGERERRAVGLLCARECKHMVWDKTGREGLWHQVKNKVIRGDKVKVGKGYVWKVRSGDKWCKRQMRAEE